MTDILFTDIIVKLVNIHNDMPDLKFGEIIQNSIDIECKRNNCNICELSTKKILNSLNKYYEREKIKRGQ